MVRQCSIKSCKSESFAGCGLSFHRLPLKEALKQKWLNAIAGCLKNVKMPAVCSAHFRPEDYYQGKLRLKLKEDAVPSIFPVSPDAEHERSLPVKMEADEDKPLANVPTKVTPGRSPKFRIEMKNQEPVIVELKIESDPIEPDGDPPCKQDDAVSSDKNAEPSDDDQTNEHLVPLSAHPVPVSDAPDPLCDVKVKVEEVNEPEAGDRPGAAEDGTVKEEDRTGGGTPQGVMSQEGGKPLRDVLPPKADVTRASKMEQKTKNVTRRTQREPLTTFRRYDLKIIELQDQVDALRQFVTEHHGAEVTESLIGSAAKSDGISKKMYRAMVKRRDEKIRELQTEVDSLRRAARDQSGGRGGRSIAAPTTQIYSIKKDERMKRANRQVLIIEREDIQNSSDIQQKSVKSTSDSRRKTLVDANPTCLIAEKNNLVQTPRKSVKKKDNPKNPLVVMQPILYPEHSVDTQTTLEDQQKSPNVKADSVVRHTGKKRNSDIRKSDEKRRAVVQPKLDTQLIMSSDLPQTSVGLQRTLDIRQNTLVIQIDGMQSTVAQPKLVRLGDYNMEIG